MRGVSEMTIKNNYVGIEKRSTPIKIMININTASAMELEILPAIGPVTSQKIIDFRNRKGKFMKKEHIKNVSGIGEKTYEKIMDKIEI